MCGIVGLLGKSDVNQSLYDALMVLQHRGQDAAGIAVVDGTRLRMHKENGMVRDVFQQHDMERLVGNIGIGQVRYPTAGTSSAQEAQPFYVNSPYGITLAHNGNLTNTDALAESLFRTERRHINTESDSEVLLNVLAYELQQRNSRQLSPDDVFAAVRRVHERCRGAYAAVALIIDHGLIGFRDPCGIRPLILGERSTPQGTEYMIASESVALTSLGFRPLRDVEPGECVYITGEGGLHTCQCAGAPRLAPCVFEYVYLSRPDSVVDRISVYQARTLMGEKLAGTIRRSFPSHLPPIDVVIPVPETSRTAALPLAQTLGVEYREGFVKNRYVGRTFIMPGKTERKAGVRRKLSAIRAEFEGKVVLLVDDSIIRGTTCRQIIQMARESGARQVYLASAAPPVRYPNVYGIDMPSPDEFVAHGRSVDEIREHIGADWLVYQQLEDLTACLTELNPCVREVEGSVFDGRYVTGDVSLDYLDALSARRSDAARVARDQQVLRLERGAPRG